MSLTKYKETKNSYPNKVPNSDWSIDYEWSTHSGCVLDCLYCYKKLYNKQFGGDSCIVRRLSNEWDVSHFSRKLPSGNIIINPHSDLFSIHSKKLDDGNDMDIMLVMYNIRDNYDYHAEKVEKFNCIFGTKEPEMYYRYIDIIPKGSLLGTTLETTETRNYVFSKASNLISRFTSMMKLRQIYGKKFKLWITISPIMQFTLSTMVNWMKEISPDIVFVGADTGKNELPEPTTYEVLTLIDTLRAKGILVHELSSLKRLTEINLDTIEVGEVETQSEIYDFVQYINRHQKLLELKGQDQIKVLEES